MDSARPLNSNKLLTLQEAAQKLAISIDALIELNDNGTLMPTVSNDGFVSYSEEQIERYLEYPAKIEAVTVNETKSPEGLSEVELVSQEPLQEQAGRAESEAEYVIEDAEASPSSGPANESMFERLVSWAGNGFYQDDFSKEYAKSEAENPLNLDFKFNLISFSFKPSKRQVVPIFTMLLILLVLGLFTQQNRIKFFLDKQQSPANQAPEFSAQTGQAVLGAQTSKIKLTGNILFALPLTVKADTSINQNLKVGGTGMFRGDITAPNVLYGVKAGNHIVITNAASQTPTISADLSSVVSTIQGQTGDVTLTGGTDISISGLTINDISTLSTVAGRGGCDSCITDADVINGLTIDATGQIAGEAIKTGVISPTVGGTGLTTYTPGDLLYASGTNMLATLPASEAGQFLMLGMSSAPEWQYVGSFAVAVVKEDNVVISPVTNVLNYSSGDFALNIAPVGQVNFTLASTLTSVTGVANDFNVGGNTLSFTGAGTVTSSGISSLT
jgi:hypothetical protein